MAKHQRQRRNPPLLKLTFGGIGACVAKTVVSPLERIRIVKQTGSFTGNLPSFCRHVLKTEGVIGFWRGNAVNCMRQFPSKSILFWANDVFRDSFRFFGGLSPNAPLPFAVSFGCGSLAGTFAVFITYPLDFLRTKVSTETFVASSGKTKGGIVNIAKLTFAKQGINGFYKGVYPTLLGVFPYEGLKFSVFNQAKEFVSRNFYDNSPKLPAYCNVGCGALAGMIAGGIMFPNDTVRRILQVSNDPKYSGIRGFLQCYQDAYKSGGMSRFYRGLVPYMARMAPASAIQFTVFDGLKNYFECM